MFRILLILLTPCFLFLSCTKEAMVKLPETKPLPVMYSYICPDDTVIRLKLLSSSPLYTSNQIDVLEPVPDADVNISGAQGTAQLIFNQTTGYYELKTNSYPIVPGEVYKIAVTTINGDVATAETQVPLTSIPINMVTVQPVAQNFGTSDRLKVSFTDEPGKVNYYRVAILYGFIYTSHTDTVKKDTRTYELYSDINRDGEDVSLYREYSQRYDSTSYYSVEYYDVFLYNCSASYYNFYKSLSKDPGTGISFPPPAEPNLMYTNVKGGFGCFAAYTRSVLRFKKK